MEFCYTSHLSTVVIVCTRFAQYWAYHHSVIERKRTQKAREDTYTVNGSSGKGRHFFSMVQPSIFP